MEACLRFRCRREAAVVVTEDVGNGRAYKGAELVIDEECVRFRQCSVLLAMAMEAFMDTEKVKELVDIEGRDSRNHCLVVGYELAHGRCVQRSLKLISRSNMIATA